MQNKKEPYPFGNEIVVDIGGKQHKSWKSYDIDSDFLIPADAFNFELGVANGENDIPDFSGEKIQVYINNNLVMTGIVDTQRHSFSQSQRSLTFNGRDFASILVDCSAPQVNVKGMSVLDAVKKLAEPLGIKSVQLKAENNPTLDKVDIDVGESAWDAIIHCANAAGLHCWFNPAGVLIVGGADYSTPPVATLYCQRSRGQGKQGEEASKNNFTQAEMNYDVSQQFSEITFLAQKHGRAGDDNKNDLKWVFKDETLSTYRPKTVVVPDVEDLEALMKFAKKYTSDSLLNSFDLTITVPDHKTQDGTLWEPGQRVHIVCEEFDLDAIFFLMGRRFMLSRYGGTQTELRFKYDGVWTPDAYREKAEKACKRKGKKGKKSKKAKKGDLIILGGS